MQQKIKRSKVRQLEPLHFPVANTLKVLFDPFRRNLTHEDRIQLIMQSNQSDVCRIALITRTRMGQFYQLYFHVSSTSTTGLISSFGIRAGQ